MVVNISVETNLEKGMKSAKKLQGELPRGAADASEKIALAWQRAATRTMMRNGSVVTGTGIRNLRTRQTGDTSHGVFGPQYLDVLDKGSMPHWPDVNNYRFISAARSYGMTRASLAETIVRKGTRPHPWINETQAKIRKKAPLLVRQEMQEAAKKSMS